MDENSRPVPIRAQRSLLILTVLIVTAAVWANTIGFQFVYDDHAQIVETRQLDSWSAVPGFFTNHVWSWKTPGMAGTYYRPIFMLWLFLVHAMFDLSPGAWHLASVGVHLLATLLVYLLAAKLTGKEGLAAGAALLFGVHPVHLESVAWVSGIPDPLVAVFLLTSFLLYLREDGLSRTLALVAFFGALLTKETAIVWPGIILAYEWFFRRKRPGARLAAGVSATIPYIAVALVYLAIRISVLHTLSSVINPIPRRFMVFTWPSMLIFYLTHLVWPFGLSIFYSLQPVTQVDFSRVLLPCLMLAILAAAVLLIGRRFPFVGFCAAWIVLPILPALNIRVFQQSETVHDRYLYLPSIGFCLLVAFASERLVHHKLGPVLLIVLVGLFAYGAVSQSFQWSTDFALFERGIATSPGNELAQQSMGTVLLRQNRPADALVYFQNAIEKNPNMWEAAYPLARCYYELGMYAQSEPYFARAAALKPTEPRPYLYFGLAQLKQGRLEAAEAYIRRAIAIKGPDDYRDYHSGLAQVLEKKGDLRGALREYEVQATEDPSSTEAAAGIERLRSEMGKQ